MLNYRLLILLTFMLVLTSTLQHWVGGVILYPQERIRSYTHDLVIGKQSLPPGQTLAAIGAQGTNRRVTIPWLAEGIANMFGGGHDRVLMVYYCIDYISLYLSFLAFWIYLRRWFEPAAALLGVSYLAFTFVTTYHGYFFHPWDRPLFLFWVLLAIFLRDGRTAAYLFTMTVALFTKFTAAIFPLLYLLVYAAEWRTSRKRRFLLILAAQAALVIAAYHLVNWMSGSDLGMPAYAASFKDYVSKNLKILGTEKFTHPVALMFLCPLSLIPMAWDKLDRFMKSSIVVAFLFLIVHFVGSVFTETRAMTPALVFLLPPALKGIQTYSDPG